MVNSWHASWGSDKPWKFLYTDHMYFDRKNKKGRKREFPDYAMSYDLHAYFSSDTRGRAKGRRIIKKTTRKRERRIGRAINA